MFDVEKPCNQRNRPRVNIGYYRRALAETNHARTIRRALNDQTSASDEAHLRTDRRDNVKNGWRKWAFLVVAVAAIATGLPTLRGTFVGADDHRLVLNHVLVNHPSWEHAWQLLTIIHRDLYQPIPLLSFSAEFAIAQRLNLFRAGLESGAWFFHLTNVLIHTANSLFVWILILGFERRRRETLPGSAGSVDGTNKLTSQSTNPNDPRHSKSPALRAYWLIATIAAVIFAVHPFQMEVIAWVNGRMMLLAILFALASLLSMNRWLDGHRKRWLAATILCAALSAMSKARVEVPALFILLAWGQRQRLDWKFWLAWVPATAATAAVAIINRHATEEAGLFSSAAAELQGSALARSVVALAWYLWHFLLPVGLSPWYPAPPRVDWLDGRTLVSVSIIISPLLAIAWSLRRNRSVSVRLAWFFVGIASTLPIILPRNLLAADRYMYLPIIGLAWSLGAIATWAYQRFATTNRAAFARPVAAATSLAVVFALIGVSWKVATHYESFVAKARRIALLFGEEPRVWERLSWGYYNEKNYADAVDSAKKALNNGGGPAVECGAWQVIALCAKDVGNLDEAMAMLRRAIETDPASHFAHFRMGLLLDELGRPDEALAQLQEAQRCAPNFNPGWLQLAALLRKLNRIEEADHAYQKALTNNPYEAPAILGSVELDLLRGDKQSLEKAERRLRELLAWMPENTIAWTHLGTVLQSAGRSGEALAAYDQALTIDANCSTALLNAWHILFAAGDDANAGLLFDRLLEVGLLSLDEAYSIHDALLARRRFGDMQRLWYEAVRMHPKLIGVRDMQRWTQLLVSPELASGEGSVPASMDLWENPAFQACRAYNYLLAGRTDIAHESVVKLTKVPGPSGKAMRQRFLNSLEIFDAFRPGFPATFWLVGELSWADGNLEAVRAAADMIDSTCRTDECQSMAQSLRSRLPGR